jgi:nitroreductase
MNVLEAIQSKRAVRLFKQEPLPQPIMEQILDAGRRSQSSKNSQPWAFVAITDREILVALSKLGDYMGHVAGAALCVAIIVPDQKHWTYFDVGQTAAYMQLAAQELGVGSCIGSIYHPEQAKTLLNLPDNMEAQAVISFGYPAPEHKPAQMGGRKPLTDVVHWDKW